MLILFFSGNALTNSLAAYYAFSSSARLLDNSFHSMDLNASLVAPTFQSNCQWSGAECAVFSQVPISSGAGNYYMLPNLNVGSMSQANGFSICMWLSFDAIDSWARVFDFGNGPDGHNILLARLGTSTNLAFHLYVDSNNTKFEAILPTPIDLGVWRHVCIVNLGMNISLFENGKLSLSFTINTIDNVLLTSNFIGKSNWEFDGMFRGKIDEFRIYSKALSAADVTTIFSYQGFPFGIQTKKILSVF